MRVPSIGVARVASLQPGDRVRGLLDRRIVTGCPVYVKGVRPLGNDRYRVSYLIPGVFTVGWRDVAGDRAISKES